ncbi:ABC-type glycerol-3-phosphate transport system substrate-binding protein [Streptomyces sp. Amel2xB2]|uniref:ABC transporter substrate-binding protein n=1 Tax=Streptomyces sp. Amel2xB2 TaxID=1305829 RepID=UPI000DBA26E7|nr:extracellular solute-binding protein [Streptomyces sp. Amel2xB2]RAJ65550.1 ABC-type glycerol-3-phosphate transport system substrate-binding protein [Streptomyces sp. Amel2xB2]
MRRRDFLTAAAGSAGAAGATALLGGCAGSADGASGPLQYLSLAWQKESIEVNKALVAAWNEHNPSARVRYVQGSWESVHDQLLTSFEGGEAPDVIHDEANDLTDFAHGGYLADLRPLLPPDLKRQISRANWDTATIEGGVYGVPFLHDPRVLVANRKLLERSGVRTPTVQRPWSWEEFEDAAKELTVRGRTYGVAWSMKEPVNQSVNLTLSTGGAVFHRERGKDVIRFDEPDSAVAELIHRQVNTDRTAARSSLGMAGSDTLPGFFAGRYAILPLNFSFRQQVRQQAPDGFEWVTLPMPAGRGAPGGGQLQGVSPQTLSVAQDTSRKKAAMAFIAFMTRPDHMARLAKGDWLVPAGTEALRDPALDTAEHGWRTGLRTASDLRASPVLGVRGYPEWKDKVATPAFQEYYAGSIGLRALRAKLVDDGNRILARYQR